MQSKVADCKGQGGRWRGSLFVQICLYVHDNTDCY